MLNVQIRISAPFGKTGDNVKPATDISNQAKEPSEQQKL